jgi:hypothetical protein
VSRGRLPIGLLVVGICLFPASCGGGSTSSTEGKPKVAINAGDQRLAERVVLKLRDFPSGWRGSEDTSKSSSNPCLAPDFSKLTETGKSKSHEFSMGDLPKAESVSAVFATAQDTKTAYAFLAGPGFADCLSDYLKKQSDSKGKVTDVSVGDLSFQKQGDETAARQIKFNVSSNGLNSSNGTGLSISVYADLVAMRVGRAVTYFLFFDAFTPFDTSQEEELVGKVAERGKTAS